MAARGEKLQKLITLLVVWALVLATMIFYERYFVSGQQAFLKESEFHSVTRAVEELIAEVERAQSSTRSFVQLATEDAKQNSEMLSEFLRLYLPDFPSQIDATSTAQNCVDPKGSPSALQSEMSGLAITFTCRSNSDPSSSKPLFTVDLTPWIRQSFQPLGGDLNDLLIADQTGKVLFQKGLNAPRVADLKPLLFQKDTDSSAKSPGGISQGHIAPTAAEPSNTPDYKDLHQLTDTNFFRETTLAGEYYELFLVPVRIPLSGVSADFSSRFLVCGLRRKTDFESDSRAIPYSKLIWATLIAVAIFSLSWPLAKLRFMSNTERFTPRQAWLLALTIFFAVTSVTLMLLNSAYTFQVRRETNRKLRQLADRINDSFKNEMESARSQMDALKYDTTEARLTPNYLDPNSGAPRLDKYAYPEIIAWLDSSGQQLRKLDIRPAPTPLVNNAPQQFFKKSISDRGWTLTQNGSDAHSSSPEDPCHLARRYYLEPLISPTTARFGPVLAASYPPDCKKHAAVLAVVIRPMSLLDPVMPPGYGFAVIDADCNVLFHSEAFRDMRENFCRESKGTEELRPWLFGAVDSPIDISYAGRPGRAFFTSFPNQKSSEPNHKSSESVGMPQFQFANGPTYLVVFRIPEHELTLNLAIMLVCSILLGFYFVLLLVAIGFLRLLPVSLLPGTLPRLLWPCDRKAKRYLQVCGANIAVLVSFWLSYGYVYELPLLFLSTFVAFTSVAFVAFKLALRRRMLLRSGQLMLGVSAIILIASIWLQLGEWRIVYAVIFVAGVAAVFLSDLYSRPILTWLKGHALLDPLQTFASGNLARAYTFAALSVIAGVCIVPCIGAFKFAYDAVNEVALKHDEIAISNALLARRNRIHEYYDNIRPRRTSVPISAGGTTQDATKRPDDTILATAIQRIGETADRYDTILDVKYACEYQLGLGYARDLLSCLHDEPSEDTSFTEKVNIAKKVNIRLEQAIARAVLMYPANQLGSEMSKLGVASTEERNGEHYFEEPSSNRFRLVWRRYSKLPGFIVESVYPPWRGLHWWGDGLLFLLTIALGLWLSSIVRRMFLTDVQTLPVSHYPDWKQVSDITRNFLIVGPAKSGKSNWLRSIRGISQADWCDLSTELKRIVDGGPCPSPSGPRTIIVIDSFEFNLKDPAYNLARLNLLEHLLSDPSNKIVLVANVNPFYFLTESGLEVLSKPLDSELTAGLLDRWARALSNFEKVRPKQSGKAEFDHKVHTFIVTRQDRKEFAVEVRKECKWTAALRDIGIKLLDEFDPSNPATREWIESGVLDFAAEYYHVIWSGLTPNERLALYQLALDGWANPKNTGALQQLESKLLIKKRPMYRIMNESFRRFVVSPEHVKEIEQWEKQQQQSTWRILRLVLIGVTVIAAVWMLHSQAALSNELAGYIAGVATLLTAVSALFGRSAKPTPAKPESS